MTPARYRPLCWLILLGRLSYYSMRSLCYLTMHVSLATATAGVAYAVWLIIWRVTQSQG